MEQVLVLYIPLKIYVLLTYVLNNLIEQIWAPKFTYLDNLKKRVLMNVHSIEKIMLVFIKYTSCTVHD